jgi:hypothetical protein
MRIALGLLLSLVVLRRVRRPRKIDTASNTIETVRGKAHAQLIQDQLAEERARKTSLEQRGIAVITTSAGLGTLLFGFAALTSSKKALPPDAKDLLIAALALFVFAAVGGLITNFPRRYAEADVKAMGKRVSYEEWHDPHVAEAYRSNARLNYHIVRHARKVNRNKALTLWAAFACELLALVCVAASVALVIDVLA